MVADLSDENIFGYPYLVGVRSPDPRWRRNLHWAGQYFAFRFDSQLAHRPGPPLPTLNAASRMNRPHAEATIPGVVGTDPPSRVSNLGVRCDKPRERPLLGEDGSS